MSERLNNRYESLRKQLISEVSDLGITVDLLHELPDEVVANVVREIILTRMIQEHPDVSSNSLTYDKLARLHERSKDKNAFLSYIVNLKKATAGIYEQMKDLHEEVSSINLKNQKSLQDLYRTISRGFSYNSSKQ